MGIKNWLKKLEVVAIYSLPVIWGLLLLIFLNTTSPLESGPLSVLSAFILLYLLVSSVLYMLVFSVLCILQLMGAIQATNKKITYYLTSVIGLGPVFY